MSRRAQGRAIAGPPVALEDTAQSPGRTRSDVGHLVPSQGARVAAAYHRYRGQSAKRNGADTLPSGIGVEGVSPTMHDSRSLSHVLPAGG